MKGILTPILMSIAILLTISSCTMVGKGGLRLIDMEVRDSERLRTNVQFWVRINFAADGNPEIRRACFYWTGDGPYCVNIKDVVFGSVAYLEVPLYARYGSAILQCYVEYVRDEKIHRSNAVASSVNVVIP